MDTYNGNSSNYPTGVRYIEDGDAPNGTNLAASAVDLADRTATLKDGDIQLSGTKTLAGTLQRTSASHFLYICNAITATSQTVTCTSRDVVIIPGTLGSDIVVTLKSSSPAPPLGTRVRFARWDAPFDAHTVTFILESTAVIITFSASAFAACEFIYSDALGAAKWLLIAAEGTYVL